MAIKMSAGSIINVLIGVIIVAGVLAVAIPQVNTQLTNLSGEASGAPFISFFAANGLVVLIIMAAVLVGIVKWLGFGSGK